MKLELFYPELVYCYCLIETNKVEKERYLIRQVNSYIQKFNKNILYKYRTNQSCYFLLILLLLLLLLLFIYL